MAAPNPWLKLKDAASKIRTPILILNRQADMLHEATDGLIRGSAAVEEGPDYSGTSVGFRVHVSTLNNYEVRLFNVRQPVTQYPATLIPGWGESTRQVKCENDVELEAAVVAYCGGPDVQKIVTGLLAQARQAMGDAAFEE